jgi:hypothetical protein
MAGDVGSKLPDESGSGPADASELESIASQAAYETFLTAVKAIEPGRIEECCADIALAYQNVVRGVESVLGSGAVIVGQLPGVNVVELSMLPRLVQGLAFAAEQVHRQLPVASFGSLYERAQHLRRMLRKAAEALAEAQLLPASDVDEVRLHGRQEPLEDCLGLVALLRRNEAQIAGRSPVTAADLAEAEQVANKLRTMLGEEDSSTGAPAWLKVVEMRDRFWTLLLQRHEVLWRCGAWLYGRRVEEHVPPLPVRQGMVRSPRPDSRVMAEPRRAKGTPALAPARTSPPASAPARDTTRHLRDLQSEMERKTRFFVRMGIIPSQR